MRDSSALAHACLGSPLAPDHVVQFSLPITSSFLFREALACGGGMWGTADEDPVQQTIADYMHTAEPGEACVFPLGDRQSVQQLLCLQVGEGEHISEEHYNSTVELCAAASAAYTRLCR